jgi:hypothetical protein
MTRTHTCPCLAALLGALLTGDAAWAQGAGLTPPPPNARTSAWAFPTPGDPEGRLDYTLSQRGDRLCDFSYAGYAGGGVALPRAPVAVQLFPLPQGDDTARIQAAIDRVSTLPLGPDGLRGAVLLREGTYRIRGTVEVRASGVVLRGEGRQKDGTVLRATGRDKRALIELKGDGRARELGGTRRRILGRVAAGARTFTVDNASGYAPGQRVMIHRPSTQEWIDFIGMDADDNRGGTRYDTSDGSLSLWRLIMATSLDRPWKPGRKDLRFDRVVTAVNGDAITVDAPLTTALEPRFGGGAVYRFEFPGRITNVGVEHLRGVSDHAGPTDEDHAWDFVRITAVEDGWVREIIAKHFAYAAVVVEKGSRRVTVQDSKCLDPISKITGKRRYSFAIKGAQLVLMQRLHARNGRHDFVTGALTSGPNVFLDCEAERVHSDVGPHGRWASGLLLDQVCTTGDLNVRNRGDMGTGQGWAGANCVVWNSRALMMIVQDPPGARNWVIGSRSLLRFGAGTWDSHGQPVWPRSLYLRQLEERLGPQALAAIGR